MTLLNGPGSAADGRNLPRACPVPSESGHALDFFVGRILYGEPLHTSPENAPENRDNDVTSPSPAGTGVDSPYAWLRLTAAVVIGTIGSVGMWSVPGALPAVQAEFAVARGNAALPFTLAMMGLRSAAS